jgi:hypothetical protein
MAKNKARRLLNFSNIRLPYKYPFNILSSRCPKYFRKKSFRFKALSLKFYEKGGHTFRGIKKV